MLKVSKKLPEIQHRIEQLEAAGWYVQLIHCQPEGLRTTTMGLYKPQVEGLGPTVLEGVGVALCHPDDQYDKAIGTQVAFQKLMRQLRWSRDRKRAVFVD